MSGPIVFFSGCLIFLCFCTYAPLQREVSTFMLQWFLKVLMGDMDRLIVDKRWRKLAILLGLARSLRHFKILEF